MGLFGPSKKATHVFNTTGGGSSAMGGPISVYGRKDRQARQAAADQAGVPVTFRRLKRRDR